MTTTFKQLADRKKIVLNAVIDLETNQTSVQPIDGEWQDFAYFLEVTGFMAYQAMKFKEMSEDEIVGYAASYIRKCVKDYRKVV